MENLKLAMIIYRESSFSEKSIQNNRTKDQIVSLISPTEQKHNYFINTPSSCSSS